MEILGLAMIYSWVHSAIVTIKKARELTQYEKWMMIFALITLTLYVVGTI